MAYHDFTDGRIDGRLYKTPRLHEGPDGFLVADPDTGLTLELRGSNLAIRIELDEDRAYRLADALRAWYAPHVATDEEVATDLTHDGRTRYADEPADP